MIVRELITRLSFQTDQRGITQAEGNLNRVRSTAESLATAVKSAVLAFASWQTVKGIVQLGDQMQNIRSKIGMLPQTIGEVGDSFDAVAQHASDSGMSLDAYASLYTRVGNSAKDYITTQEELLGISDTISKSLVVGGASAAEASSVMLQFSQALASGVLQGDEFKAMSEASPQYLDQLALAMGRPREELKKMGSQGKLTAKQVIEATKKMSYYFDERFKKMPMTVGRAMTVIQNKFATTIDSINRRTNFISNIANGFLSAFDTVATGISWVVEKMGGLDRAIRLVGIALSVMITGRTLAMLASLATVSWTVVLPWIAGIATIAILALAIEDLWVWVHGGESVIGDLIGKWSEWRDSVLVYVDTVKFVFISLGKVIGAVAALIVGMFTLDASLVGVALQAIGQMFIDSFTAIGKWVFGVWKLIFENLKADARIALDIVKTNIYNAFNSAAERVKGLFLAAFSILSTALYDYIYKPIVDAVTNAWAYVTKLISTITNGIDAAKSALNPMAAPTSPMGLGQLSKQSLGGPSPSFNHNTNVNLTIPEGSSKQQARVLENAAKKTFDRHGSSSFARDIAVYST